MAQRIYLDRKWRFNESFTEDMITEPMEESTLVNLPHTVKETPLNYFDESVYQMVSGYQKSIFAPTQWENQVVSLVFEGVAHSCDVYVNGKHVKHHDCGYTAFSADVSKILEYGKENLITVKVDSRETLNQPPFGYVVDYMTYGGIYRDVYFEVKEKVHFRELNIQPSLLERVTTSKRNAKQIKMMKVQGIIKTECIMPKRIYKLAAAERVFVRQYLDDILLISQPVGGLEERENGYYMSLTSAPASVKLWDIESPRLYKVRTQLVLDDNVVDEDVVTIGFRSSEFRKNGYYLNGRKVKLRGLNRHQSYPYVGYAMPKSMQENDARILKYELGVNAVRTSHYPQSHYFIDKCDEMGLLVFTEFPGWQHIGDDEWKNRAVENVREMVTQYRNHPSIILWGVRINESVDDDEFYARTNSVCRALDPTRQTGGVRCYKKGNLQEDVYTYNDFSHVGTNKGVEKKADVTSNKDKPYLISEYNGHMYPTKAFDWEEHRMEHMKRHAAVLNDVADQYDIAGSFGWCMFDYNTHKDFGSGDRICYHGVMDMFRNPKLAAAVYAIQQEEEPILQVSSTMDIGEHPGSNRGDVYILTNADSVKMFKNGTFVKEYTQKESPYKYLKHGPIKIDDYIGGALAEGEPEMSEKQVEDIKVILNEVARVGLYGMSKSMFMKAGFISVKYRMSMSDAVGLFNKYIGDWGSESTSYRFEAIKDGKVVKELTVAPATRRELSAAADHTLLHEDNTYDVAAVRILDVDENGNVLPFANDPITFSVVGPLEIIGPSIVSLQGGMGGTYVRTIGKTGEAKLIITPQYGESKEIRFVIE